LDGIKASKIDELAHLFKDMQFNMHNIVFLQFFRNRETKKAHLEQLQEFAKFYLANLVFCQLVKDMRSKKRVRLQQFGIIHLPNSDLTFIRNPERNKIIFIVFHLLKTYIKNPSLLFISFFTLPPTEKRRWQLRSARAYIRVGR
jgi:hypothetical protein